MSLRRIRGDQVFVGSEQSTLCYEPSCICSVGFPENNEPLLNKSAFKRLDVVIFSLDDLLFRLYRCCPRWPPATILRSPWTEVGGVMQVMCKYHSNRAS